VIFLNLIMAVNIVRRGAKLDETSKVQDVAKEVATDHHVQGSMIESSKDGIIHHIHHVPQVHQIVLAQHVQPVQHVDRIPSGGIFPGGNHTPSGYQAMNTVDYPPAFQAPLEYNAPTGIRTPSAPHAHPWNKFHRDPQLQALSGAELSKLAQQFSGETNTAIREQEAAPRNEDNEEVATDDHVTRISRFSQFLNDKKFAQQLSGETNAAILNGPMVVEQKMALQTPSKFAQFLNHRKFTQQLLGETNTVILNAPMVVRQEMAPRNEDYELSSDPDYEEVATDDHVVTLEGIVEDTVKDITKEVAMIVALGTTLGGAIVGSAPTTRSRALSPSTSFQLGNIENNE